MQSQLEPFACRHTGAVLEDHKLTHHQTRLYMCLMIYMGAWMHARAQAETMVIDIIWPMQQALNHCHVSDDTVRTRHFYLCCSHCRPDSAYLASDCSSKLAEAIEGLTAELPRASKSWQ